jgi:hypothetical protein
MGAVWGWESAGGERAIGEGKGRVNVIEVLYIHALK